MQKKKLLTTSSISKISGALFFIATLTSCEPELGEGDPTFLYDQYNDQQALNMAKEMFDTKDDLFARLIVAQINLSKYIDTHNSEYAQEIEVNYKGRDFIDKDLSRDFWAYDDLLKLSKYYDVGILLFVKNNPDAARRLLDSYCPPADFRSYEAKMDCHIGNVYGYHVASSGRYKQETAYLINLIIGTIYHDQCLVGNAMSYKADYDIDNADKQIGKYLERNAWNDEVMKRYCKPVYLYGTSEYPVDEREKYAAASQHANCPLYVELAKKEEEEAERAAKRPDNETDSAAPVPVSRQ